MTRPSLKGSFQEQATKIALQEGKTLGNYIVDIVRAHGSLAAAARALRVNRNTLRHHLAAEGIELQLGRSIEVIQRADDHTNSDR